MDFEDSDDPAEGGVEAALSAGEAVARARQDAGMTRRELADRLGEQLSTVEEWETGKQPVPPEKVDEIVAITGASIDSLASDATEVELGGVEAQRRWIRSLGPVDEPASHQLTADEIRERELPRSVRGFDVSATRRWLAWVAGYYEDLVAERDELRSRLDELEAAPSAPDDHEQVVAERDEMRQRVAELEAAAAAGPGDYEVLAAERDDLLTRVAQLEASLEERKDYDEIVSARAKLERDIADMWELLSARDDYDAIVAERDDLRRRLTEAEAGHETEQALSRALLAASRAGEELVNEAHAEAEAILAAARVAAADTERELEERRRSFESEQEAFFEALRAKALQAARDDLLAVQQEGESLAEALAAFTQRIHATARLRLETSEDEPFGGDMVDDLQPWPEGPAAAPPLRDAP